MKTASIEPFSRVFGQANYGALFRPVDFSINNFSLKKNFEILGSAHSLKEIRIKEKQNVNYIFLSPIFYSSKSKRNLGIYRFNNLRKLTNKKIVALGGIKITNLNLLKKMNISNAASISLFLK